MIADPLVRLAVALLATTTVEEIVVVAPPLIAEALDPAATWQILVPGDQFAQLSLQEGNHSCVPVTANDRLAGMLIATRANQPAQISEPEILTVVRMLAPALESRRQTAADHARLVEEAQHLKLDAISMLSHEMRTPLASIKGYATALLLEDAGWDDTTIREFLEIIDQESDRLSRLIGAILESASFDANSVRIDKEPILLPMTIRRVVERMQIQTPVHRFRIDIPPSFPVVEADSERIEQVLTNLVDNAVKYSPEGGTITIAGRMAAGEVIVSVGDEGLGLEAEDMKKLFERFFRASSNRRRVSGTGLGLPISASIVRAHGGRIWARSEPGKGTTLSFTLPYAGEL